MPAPKKSPQQYLATGFRDVDRSGDTTACTRCLDLLSDIPFFHAVKEESFRIIAGTEPERVLDAGCGAGNDLCALAPLLPPSTRILGLDASAALLSTATERIAAHRDRCFLLRGDLTHIPCRSGVFDACRIDRVLQHIPDPEQVIRELARILAPGGTLVAFDNDWDTLSIGVSATKVAGRLTRFWSDSFASGRIGKDLAGIFRRAGLSDIHAEPKTLMLTDLALAEKVFDIPALLGRMKEAGHFSDGEIAAIKTDLERRANEGTFTSGYTAYLVWGRKTD
ncbi:MAG: methyltransferase domain-containing protein [Methanoregula sp.]|jgi:SAM-dependent methyltransferase|uniref:methyltransferase domain-containing protein n=1 Tax=Methanoregula sp. TaxID=2052170 RepID=UPI003C7469BF